jgi:hypothetical protein
MMPSAPRGILVGDQDKLTGGLVEPAQARRCWEGRT